MFFSTFYIFLFSKKKELLFSYIKIFWLKLKEQGHSYRSTGPSVLFVWLITRRKGAYCFLYLLSLLHFHNFSSILLNFSIFFSLLDVRISFDSSPSGILIWKQAKELYHPLQSVFFPFPHLTIPHIFFTILSIYNSSLVEFSSNSCN